MNSERREIDWQGLSPRKFDKELKTLCLELSPDLPAKYQWFPLTDIPPKDEKLESSGSPVLSQLNAFARASGIEFRIAYGWPRLWGGGIETLVGNRLFLFSATADKRSTANQRFINRPLENTCCVVSSYRGRRTIESPIWQQSLIRTIAKAKDEGATLMVGDTPVADSILNAAGHLELPSCRFFVESKPKPFERWLADAIRHSISKMAGNELLLHVSPELESATGVSCQPIDLPLVDLLSSLLADRVVAVELQPKSKTARCLIKRIELDQSPLASVSVWVSTNLARKKEGNVYRDLMARGAVGLLKLNQRSETSSPPKPIDDSNLITEPNWLADLLQAGSSFLTHCTRARQGRWPDQTHGEYLDELLVGKTATCESPVATLHRMLSMQRIIGTNWFQRNQQSAVCFSAVPLDELLSRRVFRPHLARWDWEPFGVCIRLDVARELGAELVRYLPESKYKSLPDDEKGLFQLAGEENSKNQWELEREWRILHDLRLSQMNQDDAFVFVETKRDARIIFDVCRFPIVPLETQSCYTFRSRN